MVTAVFKSSSESSNKAMPFRYNIIPLFLKIEKGKLTMSSDHFQSKYSAAKLLQNSTLQRARGISLIG